MRIMKNSTDCYCASGPNTCYKSYSTAAYLLIRRLSIGGNAFCIFPIGKDDAVRWCCINRRGLYWDKNKYEGVSKHRK